MFIENWNEFVDDVVMKRRVQQFSVRFPHITYKNHVKWLHYSYIHYSKTHHSQWLNQYRESFVWTDRRHPCSGTTASSEWLPCARDLQSKQRGCAPSRISIDFHCFRRVCWFELPPLRNKWKIFHFIPWARNRHNMRLHTNFIQKLVRWPNDRISDWTIELIRQPIELSPVPQIGNGNRQHNYDKHDYIHGTINRIEQQARMCTRTYTRPIWEDQTQH